MLRLFRTLLLPLALAPAALAQDFSGPVRVVDGDTIWVAETKVRLFGIDAPEVAQTCELADGRRWECGAWARARAAQLYAGAMAFCEPLDTDRYGRVVARCRVRGADMAERLVRDGVAEAYRRYSLDYVDAEKAAFFEGRGLWRGRVQAPEDFRAAAAPAQRPAPAPGCAIKGNISGDRRIYHVPGQAYYAETRIDAAKGERWFCSEAEARAAAWRRARR